MKVAENDPFILSILKDEYDRCQSVLKALAEKVLLCPKGSLHLRKKLYKGKEYSYHYLVARIEGRVVNQHVPEAELDKVKSAIELRNRYEEEILNYKKRMSYLDKIIAKSRHREKPL